MKAREYRPGTPLAATVRMPWPMPASFIDYQKAQTEKAQHATLDALVSLGRELEELRIIAPDIWATYPAELIKLATEAHYAYAVHWHTQCESVLNAQALDQLLADGWLRIQRVPT